jgi:hypothetical protein
LCCDECSSSVSDDARSMNLRVDSYRGMVQMRGGHRREE